MSSLRERKPREVAQPAGISYHSAGNEAAKFRIARIAADALIARREQRREAYGLLDNCLLWARLRRLMRTEQAS